MDQNKLHRDVLLKIAEDLKNEINNYDSNKIPYDVCLKYCEELIKILDSYQYESDSRFITYGRRDYLKSDLIGRVNYTIEVKESERENLYTAAYDLIDYLNGFNFFSPSSIPESADLGGKSPIDIRKEDDAYYADGYICQEEKEELMKLISQMRKYCSNMIFDPDFTRKELYSNQEKVRIIKNYVAQPEKEQKLYTYEEYDNLNIENFDKTDSIREYFKYCFGINFETVFVQGDRHTCIYCYGYFDDNDIARILKVYPNARIDANHQITFDFYLSDHMRSIRNMHGTKCIIAIYYTKDEKERSELIEKHRQSREARREYERTHHIIH